MSVCVVCGTPKGRGRAFYCSMACRDADAKRRNSEKSFALMCFTCESEFVASDKRTKYCSARCRGFAAKSSVEGFLAHLLKHRKRHKTLSLDWLVGLYNAQCGLCAVTGVKMTRDFGKGRVFTNISIDRIDSRKGYEPGNVQLVCLAVNLMKVEMTESEFSNWADLISEGYRKRRKFAA